MAFSNDLKIKLAAGFNSALMNAQKSGAAKNLQGAFNVAMFSILENLMIEMADKISNEEFISELELSMALEQKKNIADLKLAMEAEVQRLAGEVLAAESKVSTAEAKRASARPSKVK